MSFDLRSVHRTGQDLSLWTVSAGVAHDVLMNGTGTEATRLRAARRARQLTQDELAAAAGLDQTAVSKAETGKLKLEAATLGRLADALGVSTAWLRNGEGVGPVAAKEEARSLPAAPAAAFAAALEEAFDKGAGHRLADVDAVRAAFAGQTITEAFSAAELAGGGASHPRRGDGGAHRGAPRHVGGGTPTGRDVGAYPTKRRYSYERSYDSH